jgi:hypothetical protein
MRPRSSLGGGKTDSLFSQTGPMSEAILPKTVAVRVFGEELGWDNVRMQAKNSGSANKLLKRNYRESYHIGLF